MDKMNEARDQTRGRRWKYERSNWKEGLWTGSAVLVDAAPLESAGGS